MLLVTIYGNYKGGINNLIVVKLIYRGAIIQCYTGKSASKRMKTFYNKLLKKHDVSVNFPED